MDEKMIEGIGKLIEWVEAAQGCRRSIVSSALEPGYIVVSEIRNGLQYSFTMTKEETRDKDKVQYALDQIDKEITYREQMILNS